MNDKKQLFMERLQDSEFSALTQQEMADQVGVSRKTVNEWLQEYPWRKVFAAHLDQKGGRMPKVLNALFSKAERGNLGAIELCLQVLNLWNPKQTIGVEVNDNISKMSEDELTMMVLNDPHTGGGAAESFVRGLLKKCGRERLLKMIDTQCASMATPVDVPALCLSNSEVQP